MTSDTTHDPIFEELKRLRPLAPDQEWAERVRTRYRTQLGRKQKRPARTDLTPGFARRVLVPVGVVGVCVLYIAVLLTTTLRLYGVLH
jgi:hypothetical protein